MNKEPFANKTVPSGLVLLDKPAGLTSFQALAGVKKAISSGKAGHTGTLDKFARGLLLVLTGRALKLSPWFTGCDKRYEGTIRFGVETDTLDPEGLPVAEAALPSPEAVEAVLPQFTGAILQVPPEYSAIHIDGKRASALARSGAAPQMRKRQVHIYSLKLLDWQPPLARIFVHCSSGTYIRSLARDIALAAGSRAYLSDLVRTQIAGFCLPGNEIAHIQHNEQPSLKEQSAATEHRAGKQPGGPSGYSLRPIDKSIFSSLGLPYFEIDEVDVKKIIHGKALYQILENKSLDFQKIIHNKVFSQMFCEHSGQERSARSRIGYPPEKQSAGIFCGDSFIAMAEKSNGEWNYGYVYARSDDNARSD